jgi:hypothetical protein
LIWLLQSRDVASLTEETAAIRWPSGSITTYRKYNKPALGPLGDSLDDLMTTRTLSDLRPVPRRGLSRDEEVMYIGISKFDVIALEECQRARWRSNSTNRSVADG